MLDFRIYSFLAVCEHLSYTKAAQELNLTQPAVTQHIQYLQNYYQVKFFARENNKLVITPEGRLFRDAMVSLRQSINKLEEDLISVSQNKFMIHFGSVFGVAEEDIPENMSNYIKNYPDRNIQMTVNTTTNLLKELDAGNLHFAIVEDTGFDKTGYETIPWVSEPLVCVCSCEYKIPDRKIFLKDLFNVPIIITSSRVEPDNTILRSLQERKVELSDFSNVYEVDSMSVLKQLIIKNIGVSFQSKKAVENEVEAGLLKIIPMEDYKAEHNFLFIWRKNTLHENLFRNMYTVLKTGKVDLNFEESPEISEE